MKLWPSQCIIAEGTLHQFGPSDVNFNHLVKVVSTRYLYCNVTVLLCWINKYFVGRYLRLHNVLFSKFHSLVYIHLMLLACDSYRMVTLQLHQSSICISCHANVRTFFPSIIYVSLLSIDSGIILLNKL